MAETIKCACSHCGAKYRLPAEAQGRVARCKRCGNKFPVPKNDTLDDTVLSWLTAPEDDDTEEPTEKPRVIRMEGEENTAQAAESARKMRGPIRMKDSATG